MRRRLATTAAAVTTMVVLAFCVPLALVVKTVARDRAVHAAELEARSLAAILAGSRDPEVLAPIVGSANAGSARPASVFLPDGTVLGDTRPAGPELAIARGGQAITVSVGGGDEAVLVPVQGPGGVAVARALVPSDQLTRGVARAWLVLGILAVLLIALAVGLADRLARSVVASVEQLQATAGRLRQGDRGARAVASGPPELVEVAAELNRLADEIDAMLVAEREQVADLSHRLRTPLTALRLDVEGLDPGPDRDRLVGEVEALEVAVDRQIREARGDGPTRPAGATVDLVAAVRDRLAFWSVLAADQSRSLDVELPAGPCPVTVEAGDMAAAVDALLGNVFSHTPPGTALRVAVRSATEGGVEVVVADDGPGFDTEAAVDRGASGAGSTGLGLDIARRTAEAAGGHLELGQGPSGSGAQVILHLARAGEPDSGAGRSAPERA